MLDATIYQSPESMITDAVNLKPVDFSWEFDENAEGKGWNPVPIEVDDVSEELLQSALDSLGIDPDDDPLAAIDDSGDHNAVIDGMLHQSDYNMPMMNYYYPLPHLDRRNGDLSRNQAILAAHGGAITLVEVGDGFALALTGGGMDLSDVIIEAHMLLGYLPPVHFLKDKDMFADRSPEHRDWLLAGCRRSLEVNLHWAHRAQERFEL